MTDQSTLLYLGNSHTMKDQSSQPEIVIKNRALRIRCITRFTSCTRRLEICEVEERMLKMITNKNTTVNKGKSVSVSERLVELNGGFEFGFEDDDHKEADQENEWEDISEWEDCPDWPDLDNDFDFGKPSKLFEQSDNKCGYQQLNQESSKCRKSVAFEKRRVKEIPVPCWYVEACRILDEEYAALAFLRPDGTPYKSAQAYIMARIGAPKGAFKNLALGGA